LEVGDTAGLETCATNWRVWSVGDSVRMRPAYLNMSLLTELGISLGVFLQICRAYGAEEKSRRQELFGAGQKPRCEIKSRL
jgi:uncharacterized membrane protein